MLECRTAEDVREANRRRLEWRKKMFPAPVTTQPPAPKRDPERMTVKEATHQSGFAEATVRRWCRDHGIADRKGGRWLVVRERLNAYIDMLNLDQQEAYESMLRERLVQEKELAQSKSLFQRIIAAVCVEYTVTRDQLYSVRRTATVTRARHVAIYLADMMLKDWSLTRLGREFQRDHTTIIHAINKIRDQRLTDREIDRTLSRLQAELSNG